MDRPTKPVAAQHHKGPRSYNRPATGPRASGPSAVRTARYLLWSALATLLLLVSGIQPHNVAGQSVASSTPAPPVDLKQLPPETRLREGSRLAAQRGYFRLAGDRVAFHTVDGSRRLIALENLNLERIINQITATGEESLWSVSGEVTEFRGLNYLLVTHAVLKSDAPTATP